MQLRAVRDEIVEHASPLSLQLRRAAVAVAAGVGIVLAFVALAAVAGEPFKLFSKEPAESLGARPYIGWLAHLSAMVWLASGSAALLAGEVLRRRGRRRTGSFLLAFGAYTTVLTVDDLFLGHESLSNNGFPEELIYLLYGATAVFLLLRFTREISRNDGLLFLLALVLWVASVGFDFVQETVGFHQHVLEDGAKVIGVVVWAAWLATAAARELMAVVPEAGGREHDVRTSSAAA